MMLSPKEAFAIAEAATLDLAGEPGRLAELARYDLVMDREEEAFSDLARLAARIFNVPLAGVSLVDSSHVWIKGRHGVDISCLNREGAFCSFAVESNQEVFKVPDTHKDGRFLVNSLVTLQPHVRSYHAAVLVGQRGYALGTLWVMDTKPRRLQAGEADILMAIGSQAMRLLELQYRFEKSGLPARSAFVSNLQCALTQSAGGSQACRVADCSRLTPSGACLSARQRKAARVGYVQLRNLPLIHSLYGDAVGRQVVQAVAERVQHWKSPGDMLCQVNDESFAFALFQGARRDDERLLDLERLLSRPVQLGDESIGVTCSIGLAESGTGPSIASALLDRAAAASSLSQPASRAAIRVFDDEQLQQARQRARIERCVGECIARRQVQPGYQPQVDVVTGRVIGFEALCRLHHDVEGLMTPSRFLEAALATGQIRMIDMLMLERVCRDVAAWRERGLPVLPVSINLSRESLLHESTIESIATMLEELQIPPSLINVEITESGLEESAAEVQQRARELKRIGLRVELDDFGTGLSNLDTLRELEFDCLKADRQYVHGVSVNMHTAALLHLIRNVADLFGVTLICEGVEDESDLRWAIKQGLRYFQGWYFAADMPADAVAQLLLDMDAQPAAAFANDPAALARFLRRGQPLACAA